MPDFTYNSFKHEKDKQTLHKISEAVFVLKLLEQNQLEENGFDTEDVTEKRNDLVLVLDKLISAVGKLINITKLVEIDISYLALANKFLQINPSDVSDRTEALQRLKDKLSDGKSLLPRDFQQLDKLQGLLEAEVLAALKDLYRF
jgi:hypothetical protein